MNGTKRPGCSLLIPYNISAAKGTIKITPKTEIMPKIIAKTAMIDVPATEKNFKISLKKSRFNILNCSKRNFRICNKFGLILGNLVGPHPQITALKLQSNYVQV